MNALPGVENDTEPYTHGLCRAFLSVKSFCVSSHDLLKNTGINSLSCILIIKRKECIERKYAYAYVKVSYKDGQT